MRGPAPFSSGGGALGGIGIALGGQGAHGDVEALKKLLQHGEQDTNKLTALALRGADTVILFSLVTLFDMVGEVRLAVP